MPDDLFEREKKLFLSTYNRLPINISYGEGVFLYDKDGNKYLDFFSGLAVNALGYGHPRIVEAVSSQISKFAHLSNNYITDIQTEFAELLVNYSEMSKVFLVNSGTEAIEAAIKIIRKKYGPDKIIYSLSDSFHGRTYGAMSLMGRDKYKNGFGPFLENFGRIDFNSIEDLNVKINSKTAAVFMEFIQGEGGINPVSEEFINRLNELKAKYGFAIVSDGIQCGTGRTGKPYSHCYYNVKPDLIVTAKAIGGGLPMGALLTSPDFDHIFSIGNHGTTFGGNPLSCAAGKVVLEEVYENGLMENAAELGSYFISQLNELKERYPEKIKEIRGKGFMIGIELLKPCTDFVAIMRGKKILINCTNERVLRILPPLIATKDNIDFFLFTLNETLKNE